MIDHTLTLDYTLAPGWIAPFVNGLKLGQAYALRCHACQRVGFPPVQTCDCGETSQEWVELAGAAEIIFDCDGQDGQFALAQFKGADTLTVVRLEDFESTPSRSDSGFGNVVVKLCPANNGLPALIVRPAIQTA